MDTNEPRTNRRTVLKTVAGSGPLTLAAGVGTTAGHEYTTITTGVYRGEPTSTAEVPTAWYEKVKAARRAMGALADEYLDSRWVVSVGRTSTEERIEGFRIPELELHVVDLDGALDDDSLAADGIPENDSLAAESIPENDSLAADAIPDGDSFAVDGVPVDVVESGAPEPQTCEDEPEPCETDPFGPFDRIPGGAAVRTEKPSGLRARQTGGVAVETSDGESRYLTAAHGFGDDGCSDEIEGLGLEQRRREIGTVLEYDWNADWAAIELGTDADVEGFAHEVVPHSVPVVGHVTEDGIDYLKDFDRTVYRYGRGTCEEEGTIESENLYSYCSDGNVTGEERRFVRTSMVSDRGDSGGPHYRLLEGEYPRIEIIGVHAGCSRGAWASTAYAINGRWDFEFGSGEILDVDL